MSRHAGKRRRWAGAFRRRGADRRAEVFLDSQFMDLGEDGLLIRGADRLRRMLPIRRRFSAHERAISAVDARGRAVRVYVVPANAYGVAFYSGRSFSRAVLIGVVPFLQTAVLRGEIADARRRADWPAEDAT